MDRWRGGVAVVTGASSGIGEATAEALAGHGMRVVALARREDRLQELKKRVESKKGILYPIKTDITKKEEVEAALEWTEKNLGGIHVLINNAGIAKSQKFSETTTEEWESMYNLNVLALSVMSREAIKSMTKHNIDGHIINICSIAGHISTPFPGIIAYFASKRAVAAISEGLRGELAVLNSNIKVTNLSPGLVKTEIITRSGQEFDKSIPIIESEDIANGVIYAISQPPNVLVSELTLQPVRETIYNLHQGSTQNITK